MQNRMKEVLQLCENKEIELSGESNMLKGKLESMEIDLCDKQNNIEELNDRIYHIFHVSYIKL
jgi:hypothetical protein